MSEGKLSQYKPQGCMGSDRPIQLGPGGKLEVKDMCFAPTREDLLLQLIPSAAVLAHRMFLENTLSRWRNRREKEIGEVWL